MRISIFQAVFKLLPLLVIVGCATSPTIVYIGDGLQYMEHDDLLAFRDSVGVSERKRGWVHSIWLETYAVDARGNGLFLCAMQGGSYGKSPVFFPLAKCDGGIVFWSNNFSVESKEMLEKCAVGEMILSQIPMLDSMRGAYIWHFTKPNFR